MYGTGPKPRLRDRLITIGAVWAALILAGLSIGWLPASPAAAALSFAVYMLLLALYACWTGPGRRTGLGVYLLGGLLYPAVSFALVIPMASLDLSPNQLDILTLPAVGLRVGLEAVGGADTPIEFYLPYWLFSLLVPIAIVVLARGWFMGEPSDDEAA